MKLTLAQFNALEESEAEETLLLCCGSARWASEMENLRPFEDLATLFSTAASVASRLPHQDWREAFSHHPRIGDLGSLRKKFASTEAWASQEQQGAASASEEVLSALAAGNAEYEARFGHVFLICATAKSAAEMLAALRARLKNSPDAELRIAAAEQIQITRIRLEKLFA